MKKRKYDDTDACQSSEEARCKKSRSSKTLMDENSFRVLYPGYNPRVNDLREKEFPLLGKDIVFVDHAGSTLYSKSQLESTYRAKGEQLLSNPHSKGPTATRTLELINDTRQQVLRFFNASPAEYAVIFTAGATASIKLVGECFPWTKDSLYCYNFESHTSVLGVREYALAAGAGFKAVTREEVASSLGSEPNHTDVSDALNGGPVPVFSLYALPGECNFNGRKVDLTIIPQVKETILM